MTSLDAGETTSVLTVAAPKLRKAVSADCPAHQMAVLYPDTMEYFFPCPYCFEEISMVLDTSVPYSASRKDEPFEDRLCLTPPTLEKEKPPREHEGAEI